MKKYPSAGIALKSETGGKIRCIFNNLTGVLLPLLIALWSDSLFWGWFSAAVINNFLAILTYRADKIRASAGNFWRIPEKHLHQLTCLGGWPGAFWAQRRYHHKNKKISFQLCFYAGILLHLLISQAIIYSAAHVDGVRNQAWMTLSYYWILVKSLL